MQATSDPLDDALDDLTLRWYQRKNLERVVAAHKSGEKRTLTLTQRDRSRRLIREHRAFMRVLTTPGETAVFEADV
jgi:hypothetical protein